VKNDYTLAEAIQLMLREYRLKPRLDESRIQSLWAELMGKTIATYTSNIVLRKGVLHLTIISAPLKHELSFAKDKIIMRLNEALGDDQIKDVIIR
jgi:hypothetical protein